MTERENPQLASKRQVSFCFPTRIGKSCCSRLAAASRPFHLLAPISCHLAGAFGRDLPCGLVWRKLVIIFIWAIKWARRGVQVSFLLGGHVFAFVRIRGPVARCLSKVIVRSAAGPGCAQRGKTVGSGEERHAEKHGELPGTVWR